LCFRFKKKGAGQLHVPSQSQELSDYAPGDDPVIRFSFGTRLDADPFVYLCFGFILTTSRHHNSAITFQRVMWVWGSTLGTLLETDLFVDLLSDPTTPIRRDEAYHDSSAAT
jgi:hypothetical protein